jgi:hypothetical protein
MQRTIRSLAFAVAALAITTQSASAGQFKHPVYYPAGERPYRVIATQLTDSGNIDIAFADWLSDQICIMLGNGDGTFQKRTLFPVPAPISLTAGDFNEDGNQDLAVVESGGTGDGAIAIFLGDGKGGFKLSASYAIGVASVSLAVADFDGDGHLDVAVTNKGFDSTGSMMTFFGDGHGKLRDRKTYKTAGGPFGIAAGDLKGGHSPDLAVTQIDNGSVTVFLNDGTGKFLKPATYNAGAGEAADVKIADLRNNGKQDLVIANLSQGMVVLLNKGNGTFGPAKIYPPCSGNPVCEAPEAVVVADFNLDGHLDAAVATNIDDSYFYYGKGDGTFGLAKHLKDTIHFQGGFSIAVGDFNNDKAPDLAIPIELKGKVAIMLNTK